MRVAKIGLRPSNGPTRAHATVADDAKAALSVRMPDGEEPSVAGGMKAMLRTVPLAVLALMAPMTARADAQAGYEAWERGDFATAIKNWRPLAISGDAEAQYNMGQAYRLGRGVPAVDLKQAEDWFRRAAIQGNPKAKAAYGIVMFQNGKRAEALPYLEEAAGYGNANAQYIYGTVLFNGELVPRDYPRAYALMTRASAGGIAPASAALVQMDKVIPLAERTRGLALARVMENAGSRPDAGAIGAPPPAVVRRPSPGPVRIADVPPSGLPPAPEPIETAPPPPVKTAKPPVVKPPAVKPPAPVAVATGGKWRVQLGAFANPAGANALWTGARARIAALAPYSPQFVKAGSVTRVQAGPLASRAAADALCAKVKAAGQACVAVAP